MEITFYQFMATPLEKTLAKLLEKVYESSKKAVVVLDSKERVDSLNAYLWTYSTAAFLPHGSSEDTDIPVERQPICLTTRIENPNQAQVIVITTGDKLTADGESFQRGLDLFDGNNEMFLKQAQERYKFYQDKGHSCIFWQQNLQGQWEKIDKILPS